jgi:hypothetical protein
MYGCAEKQLTEDISGCKSEVTLAKKSWSGGFGDATFAGRKEGWQVLCTEGGVATPDPGYITHNQKKCTPLKVNVSCAVNKFGANWNTGDIENCVKHKVAMAINRPGEYCLFGRNCRDVSSDWIKDCCLEEDSSLKPVICPGSNEPGVTGSTSGSTLDSAGSATGGSSRSSR